MPDFWSNLASILWFTLWFFFMFAYIYALFAIIADLFRDHTLGGGWKAVWIICLIIFPLISMLVYLIARGKGMAERAQAAAVDNKAAADSYIRQVAAGSASPTDEIARAKALLDAGTISQAEYDKLKAKALS